MLSLWAYSLRSLNGPPSLRHKFELPNHKNSKKYFFTTKNQFHTLYITPKVDFLNFEKIQKKYPQPRLQPRLQNPYQLHHGHLLTYRKLMVYQFILWCNLVKNTENFGSIWNFKIQI